MTHVGQRYWERHAKRYDRSTRFLARPVPRMLELAVGAVRVVRAETTAGRSRSAMSRPRLVEDLPEVRMTARAGPSPVVESQGAKINGASRP